MSPIIRTDDFDRAMEKVAWLYSLAVQSTNQADGIRLARPAITYQEIA